MARGVNPLLSGAVSPHGKPFCRLYNVRYFTMSKHKICKPISGVHYLCYQEKNAQREILMSTE